MSARVEGSWILTYTGRQFYPLAPEVQDIVIDDIAHALSNLCRYNGHCRTFYSIAEHSLRVSLAVPTDDALWGLLHDASEAYLGDFVSPLKYHTECGRAYQRHEANLMATICARFGLAPTVPASVLRADHEQLQEEMHWLMDPATRFDRRMSINAMPPLQAELEFLNRFRELTR